MIFIALRAVRERTAPNTNSFTTQLHAAGERIEMSHVITDEKGDTWGAVKDKDRAFVAIIVSKITYCVTLEEPTTEIEHRLNALERWARTQGYTE
jgi:phosphoribosyl-ATP pyrophosphohydrolase